MKSIIFILTIVLVISGCASSPETESPVVIGTRMNSADYQKLVSNHTKREQKYDGFYNTLDVSATFLNSDVQTAILQKKAETLQWQNATAQAEREKLFQQNSNSTQFFVSFFIPTRRLNNLDKPDSVWKVYMEVGGQKYEGQATKNKEALETLQATYPQHSRWSIPYIVSFKIPLSQVEKQTVKLVFASSVAQSALQF